MAEKSEEPTSRKKKKTRDKGQVPQSQEVGTIALLSVALLVLSGPLGLAFLVRIAEITRSSLSGQVHGPDTIQDLHAILVYHAGLCFQVLLPIFPILIVVGVLSRTLQFGFLFSWTPLKPKLSKLSLTKGLAKMVKIDKLYELAKSALKLLMVGLVAFSVLGPAHEDAMKLVDVQIASALLVAGEMALELLWLVLAVFLVFAVVDLIYVRFKHQKELKMTKEEVRDEHKQREGDPKVRAKIRQKQRDASAKRMVEALPQADVVVTNPTHFAVALRYRPPAESAPKVVAKGRNLLALRLRREAEALGIPIVENPPLAQLLYKTAPVGEEVPEEVFKAVAEVLAYVFRLNPSRASAWRAA